MPFLVQCEAGAAGYPGCDIDVCRDRRRRSPRAADRAFTVVAAHDDSMIVTVQLHGTSAVAGRIPDITTQSPLPLDEWPCHVDMVSVLSFLVIVHRAIAVARALGLRKVGDLVSVVGIVDRQV